MSKENTVISKKPIPLDSLPPLSKLAQRKRLIAKPEQPRHPLETLYEETMNVEGAVVNRKDTVDDTRTVNDTREGDCGRVSTPAFKPLPEPVRYGIRKVKKIAAVSGDKGEEKVKRRLDFTDHTEPTSDSRLNSYSEHYIKDYGLDLFDYLLKRETIPKTPRMSNAKRACIVNWMVKVNGPKGNPAVVQTAAWYFDHVLAVGAVQVDKLRVVAAACYWIALKIQGHVTSAKKLVSGAYSVKLLLCAEKAVLQKLKFPIQPVVPQDFISYWSWVCDASNYAEIEAVATLLYMASLVMHHKLVQHYPSVLAAAAMNNALHLLRRKELFGKLTENAVYKVAANKEQHLGVFCLFQRKVLREMSSPFYIYKALLNTSKDYTTTIDKILTSLKKNK